MWKYNYEGCSRTLLFDDKTGVLKSKTFNQERMETVEDLAVAVKALSQPPREMGEACPVPLCTNLCVKSASGPR